MKKYSPKNMSKENFFIKNKNSGQVSYVTELFNSGKTCNALTCFLDKYFSIQRNINKIGGLYETIIRDVETVLIKKVMKITEFNKSKTARILGISRNTLNSKIQQLKLRCTIRSRNVSQGSVRINGY